MECQTLQYLIFSDLPSREVRRFRKREQRNFCAIGHHPLTVQITSLADNYDENKDTHKISGHHVICQDQ